MIRKTISMPDAMSDYIDGRVKSGLYGNDSEYIRDLIRKDQEDREAIAAIQAAIDEGMEGPDVRKTVRQVFEEAVRFEASPARTTRARKKK